MAVLCNDNRLYRLSSSGLGSISQCGCCESYQVSVGNITLRMERGDLIGLAQLLIDALEVKAISENSYPDLYVRNQA